MRYVHCIFLNKTAYTRNSVFDKQLYEQNREKWTIRESKRAVRENREPRTEPKMVEITIPEPMKIELEKQSNLYRIVKPYLKLRVDSGNMRLSITNTLSQKHIKTLKEVSFPIEFTLCIDEERKIYALSICHPFDMFNRKRGIEECNEKIKDFGAIG